MDRTTAGMTALVILTGCASVEVGRDFDLAAFDSKVQRGVSTRSDVRSWLGAPAGVGASIETSGERFEQWTYYRGEGRFPVMGDAHLKLLQIKFDERGIVRAYNWSGEGR